MDRPVRRAAVAGAWYPGDPEDLSAELDAYLASAGSPSVPGRLLGLISPHAGLHYSGPVAAYGYSLLKGRRDLTAVLIGPSHHYAFDGVALYGRGAFETPYGQIPIDEGLASDLIAAEPTVRHSPGPHGEEHCLEMQLPFLQRLVSGLRILPLLMGGQSRGDVDALARALGKALVGRDAVILIASSDLSHFHPAPEANRLDGLVVRDVEQLDAEALMTRLEASHQHACGGAPIVTVMKTAQALGANHATVLRYADSGDVPPRDKHRVVGYLSAALTAV